MSAKPSKFEPTLFGELYRFIKEYLKLSHKVMTNELGFTDSSTSSAWATYKQGITYDNCTKIIKVFNDFVKDLPEDKQHELAGYIRYIIDISDLPENHKNRILRKVPIDDLIEEALHIAREFNIKFQRIEIDTPELIIKYINFNNNFESNNNDTLEPLSKTEDIPNNYINKYEELLFGDSYLSLKDIYIPNLYSFMGGNTEPVPYDDLFELIKHFLNNTLTAFLNEKEVSCLLKIKTLLILGYPGVGKSSLVTKIIYDNFYNKYLPNIKIRCINFSEVSFEDKFSVSTVCDKLKINRAELHNSLLIMDALDEWGVSEENCVNCINKLIDDLRAYNCKLIITCRHNYINVNEIRMSMAISLHPFSPSQVAELIAKYQEKHKEFDVVQFNNKINALNKDVAQIIMIPYILYVCIKKNIDMSKVTELGNLYDILFDGANAQAAITNYNNESRYNDLTWVELHQRITRLSILMNKSNDFSINKEVLYSTFADKLISLNQFRTEFYLRVESNEKYKFIHHSIGYYFIAKELFKIIKSMLDNEKPEKLLNKLNDIFGETKKINYSIITFFKYHLKKNSFNKNEVSKVNEIFLRMLEIGMVDTYSYTREGNLLLKIHSSFYNVFTILSEVLLSITSDKINLLQKMDNDAISLFIKYTNIYDSSLDCLQHYNLKNLNLEGINLVGTKLAGIMISNTILSKASLKNINIAGAYLINCKLIGANLESSNCKNTDFLDSQLIAANFKNAKLGGANFHNANLSYADLRFAGLIKTNLRYTNLWSCTISVDQLLYIDLDVVKSYNIQVFDEERKLSWVEIKEAFKKIRPVAYALRFSEI